MRAFLHMEIGLPCRAGDAQDKEVLIMYLKYEKACIEAKMTKEEIKEIRKIFDRDKKKLKEQKQLWQKKNYVFFSMDNELEDIDEGFCYADENVNVEEEAIDNACMQKLLECLSQLSEDEKEDVLARFDPKVSFVKYARNRGIPKTTLIRKTDKVVEKLRKMMGV